LGVRRAVARGRFVAPLAASPLDRPVARRI
jgi:hypothetical protein